MLSKNKKQANVMNTTDVNLREAKLELLVKSNWIAKFVNFESYIEIPKVPSFSNGDKGFTVMLWFSYFKIKQHIQTHRGRIVHASVNSMPLLSYRKSKFKTGFELELVTYPFGMRLSFCTSVCFSGKLDLNPSTWYHVAVVGDDDERTVTFYIDGRKVNTEDYPRERSDWFIEPWKHAKMLMGTNQDGHHFNGLISEVSVWKKALQEEQIKSNMHKHMGISRDVEGLVAYWPLNEPPDEKVCYDFGPNNLDGTNHDLERTKQSHKSLFFPNVVWKFHPTSLLYLRLAIILFFLLLFMFCLRMIKHLSKDIVFNRRDDKEL